MKIFISWSGTRSRAVALALRDWLPAVINSIEPFVSSEDIYAGSRWQKEIAEQLESTNFGIVCVTKENQHAPWLNFEAGALAKAVESSRVVPLAVNLKPTDVEVPLGQFQAQPATKDGVRAILVSINSACSQQLSESLLERATEKWWPDLDAVLEGIEELPRDGAESVVPERTERELLEETLETVRSLARRGIRDGESEPIGPDHPLVAQLDEIVREHDCRVLRHHSDRRVGISGGRDLPEAIREELIRHAGIYGVGVDFLAKPRIRQAPLVRPEDEPARAKRAPAKPRRSSSARKKPAKRAQ